MSMRREARKAYTRLSKQQRQELFNVGEGVGVMHIKSAPNCILTIEFYIDPHGILRYIKNGVPVLPIDIQREEA